MKRCLALFALAAAALAATFTVTPDPRWKIIGPGGGGAQFSPTLSPHNPSRVLVACDMTGSYITDDAGESWHNFNLMGVSRFFVFDPHDPDRIYAQAAGLWRTANGGKSWELIDPRPESIKEVTMPDDHAGVRFLTEGPEPGNISALAVDPADSKILYAAVSSEAGAVLRLSHDGAESWRDAGVIPIAATRLYIDPESPKNSRTIYAIGNRSVAVRENGAWRENPGPLPTGSFSGTSAGFPSDGGKPVIYAVSGANLFVSEDGGASWRSSSVAGLDAARYETIATSLNHPGVAYVSVSRATAGGVSVFGVAKTTNRGASWDFIRRETFDTPGAGMHDAWLTRRFGPGWGESPLGLGVAPNDPDIVYSTDYGRTMRSTDGGSNWTAVYSKEVEGGGYTTRGLDVTTNYGIHFDPFDAKRIFISYTDIGLFHSEDGGRSWFSSTTNGVPRRWVNTTYWLEFDPEVKGRMWAAMSGNHDLPRPKMWRTQNPDNYVGGVVRSDDGGKTWTRTTNGMGETAATHILLDPTSPKGSRVLYVTGFGRGVFKSTDGGETWTLKNNGLPAHQPFAWRLIRDRNGVLYLVIARRSENGGFGNAEDGFLYRSDNGAEHWTKIELPVGVNGPNGLAVDSANPRRLYLAVWGRRATDRAVDGGIFLSNDAGASWRNVLSKDQHVYDITIDPRNANILYACGFESSAWKSADRGETWSRIPGYDFKWGHRVFPDPRNASKIYITTYGGSVWHGPAGGTDSYRSTPPSSRSPKTRR